MISINGDQLKSERWIAETRYGCVTPVREGERERGKEGGKEGGRGREGEGWRKKGEKEAI